MAYVIINPNSTAAMTEGMLEVARAAVPGVTLEGWTNAGGPPAIQGHEDGLKAAPSLLELIDKANAEGFEGIIIACFDDTALEDAQARSEVPVIGIGQAAYHIAALRGWSFSVVTTLPISVPIIEGNIIGYGFEHLMGKVRASDVPVLALEEDPDKATEAVAVETARAMAGDGVDCVILGCAGMAKLTAHLRGRFDKPILDGVESAARLITAL
ncbi:aspartate/glutamate racemase family protein [Salipiger sp. PrR002]|uniref:aspartate/glutamate racemase family protein n=1 Tax=Salipiger sp. PrR002 TaxID=2706489 RepID=UPI0013BDC57F|nr:aspartate/glutamate racemase family protein [Salipiger sp. PrR002]NDV99017.1 HyuE hydantoin racemase [Salipiger sp. PrR002]NDW55970.1 HyuE hydantoin racemase [Salipiger sp. PrR004]